MTANNFSSADGKVSEWRRSWHLAPQSVLNVHRRTSQNLRNVFDRQVRVISGKLFDWRNSRGCDSRKKCSTPP
jgi:hypothetical protein